MNGPLIQFVKLAVKLNTVNGFLVLMAFYLSYLFLALPAAASLRHTGMNKGMAIGLLVMARAPADSLIALRNTIGSLGVPLEESARIASTYPAQFLAITNYRGHIAAGRGADFADRDAALGVQATCIGGGPSAGSVAAT